ncbi:MAG: class I SAM-dependent methyltransferase [Lachnospiraceae bacterium]|nr:class I SAM-dependent methyltransferase [Lachnospiraceae bacterium]
MNGVNKTLYIPLYGKAYVSRKGIILEDKKAEEIWDKEQFELKGKSKSKWLAYYMGMRSAVFDEWVKSHLTYSKKMDNMIEDDESGKNKECIVLHIGCGMDSRACRVGSSAGHWYDVDFPDVIEERRKYYRENDTYHMLSADARETDWISSLPKTRAIIVLEGISMYFKAEEMQRLLKGLTEHFTEVNVLMDCYTKKAAKASKYKNPINDVGVTVVYGIDDPHVFEENTGLEYVCEHNMTPDHMITQLVGFEKAIFKPVFGGKISKAMYRMYEYRSNTSK